MTRLCGGSLKRSRVWTHFSFGDGSARCLHYEVGPEGVKELQQDQEQVEDPPGRVWPHDLPTLEEGGV